MDPWIMNHNDFIGGIPMKLRRTMALALVLALVLGLLPAALAAVGSGWNDECKENKKPDALGTYTYGKHNCKNAYRNYGYYFPNHSFSPFLPTASQVLPWQTLSFQHKSA